MSGDEQTWWGTVGPSMDYLYELEQSGEAWVPRLIDARTDEVISQGPPVRGFDSARREAMAIAERALGIKEGSQAPRARRHVLGLSTRRSQAGAPGVESPANGHDIKTSGQRAIRKSR